MQHQRQSHLNVVVPCVIAIVVMLGLVAASPALDRLFSELTASAGSAPSVTIGAGDAAGGH